jgi:competence protein ComEC
VQDSPADLRLVPAGLTAWAVTAAGITWGVGGVLAAISVAVGMLWWPAQRWFPVLRVAGAGLLGAAVVGAGFGASVALRTESAQHHPIVQRFGDTVPVTVRPGETPRSVGNGRLMFAAGLLRIADHETGGRVMVFAPVLDFADLSAGQPVRFRARISRPVRRDLSVAVLTATGPPAFGEASGVQRAARSLRDRFAAAARSVLPADQAAMLPGLVLGDTSGVTPETIAEFRIAGLTHLTAVSGANVTIVCGAVLLSAGLIGPRFAVLLAGLVLVAFVIVVQPGASVLRAAVMGAIGLLAMLSARRRQGIPVLAATVIALLVFAPQLAVDVGFALSVSATAALVVLAPAWSARLTARGWPKPLADALCIALAAQLVTAPLVAAISGRFSLVAVAANLVVAVVIPPITLLGSAAAALCPLWPAAGALLIRFTGPELWWLLHVAHAAAALPGAAVPVPDGWAGIVLLSGASVLAVVLWRWRWFRLMAAAVLLGLLAWSVSGVVGGS